MDNKSLLRKVANMWLTRRHININDITSIISSILFALSLIGIFTIKGDWRIVSFGLLAITFIILFYEFFFELPAKVYAEAQNRIAELLPLEQMAKAQRDNPSKFMSARIDSLMVKKGDRWLGLDLFIASRLPYPIAIKKVNVILQIPKGEGKSRYDMATRVGEQFGVVSGEALQHDTRIRVHLDNDPEIAKSLLGYVGGGAL